jgi:hypothetical protein
VTDLGLSIRTKGDELTRRREKKEVRGKSFLAERGEIEKFPSPLLVCVLSLSLPCILIPAITASVLSTTQKKEYDVRKDCIVLYQLAYQID